MKLLALVLLGFISVVQCRYEPNWDSLDSRRNPLWFDDAKFGIFMHWGLYSVPAFDSSEWFWGMLMEGYERQKDFMEKNYKPDFQYQDFAVEFRAQFFDPNAFTEIVKKSGARYFVVTTKHHEGYCMWPSDAAWNWNSVDTGPHRDIIGDLEKAFRANASDVAFGLYFSLLDWAHPYYLSDKKSHFRENRYPPTVSTPQMYDIVNRYKPDVVWGDGNWEASSDYWNTKEFLAWLFNDSPVKDKVVINDRWGNETQCVHGGSLDCHDMFSADHLPKFKWENCMKVDSAAWGYRLNHRLASFFSSKQLINLLMKTAAYGGNLLMDVGPTSAGTIIPIFEERLEQMGAWLSANGEALYGTKPWIYQNDTITPSIWYTSKLRSPSADPYRFYNNQTKENTIVYATFSTWPVNGQIELGAPRLTSTTTLTILGYGKSGIRFKAMGDSKGVRVDLSGVNWVRLKSTEAWVLKFEYLADDNHSPFG